MMKTNQYALFSEVYHQIFDQSLYQAWQNYLEDQVETRLTHQEGLKILDMACGDGRLTLEMAKAGYDVTGMDLSEEMLAIAQAEMQEAGIYIPYFQADMRSFKTETSYDLISIFCDSICYLDSLADLEATFKACYEALEKGGLLLFDIHSSYQMNCIYPDFQWVDSWDDAVFTWQSDQLRGPNTIDHLLNIFVKDEDSQLYQRFEEVHQEQIWPLINYQEALLSSGFTDIQITADFSQDKPSEKSRRLFFSCKK